MYSHFQIFYLRKSGIIGLPFSTFPPTNPFRYKEEAAAGLELSPSSTGTDPYEPARPGCSARRVWVTEYVPSWWPGPRGWGGAARPWGVGLAPSAHRGPQRLQSHSSLKPHNTQGPARSRV